MQKFLMCISAVYTTYTIEAPYNNGNKQALVPATGLLPTVCIYPITTKTKREGTILSLSHLFKPSKHYKPSTLYKVEETKI
jgi:hypothetical protein